jgi:hypothetical protein
MKKERIYTESCIEVSIRKEAKEQIQTLAARQNVDVEQVSEELVRRGLEIYLNRGILSKRKGETNEKVNGENERS